ncbi:UDP-glycosyltransferase UGT5-like isoform X1 [Schistocerca americana]|uniref:UDP-glycosyltransferase UGT5-like isoform X1 n=2 Tax=Schistocerca americana TaxID=7009 RepID=UPI001F4F3D6A|nr:UDP-glycosyltransferase UGT5-like isoform X1 [Schistocerca americana]XP_046994614.1 UDP-glycosyltransferase UGT5-like isoform X1 [Schistocerca americana]
MSPPVTMVLVLMLAAGVSRSAKILGIIPTPSISHQLPFRLIALELVRRGHQVTLMTTDPIKKNIQNYSEIDLSMSYDYWRTKFDFVSMADQSPTETLTTWNPLGLAICEMQLESLQMKDFLRSQPSFDVIILEKLIYYCYYGLIHQLGSPPAIGFVSLGAPAPVLSSLGNPNNPAYSPDLMLEYTDRMSFWQRLYNAYVIALFSYNWNYEVMPKQNELLRRYFGPDLPPTYEMDRNFSLLLVNNHFSVNYPRPLLPNVVELTGLHLEKQRKPLPQDIQDFLDGAKDGAIYFSLGSNVRSTALPEHKRRAFLEAFAQLPQRVLWKWEVDSLPGQPENVMIAKWLPQQDVLAHPNIKLFITQGGLQSMNEASYFAVPVIGIPFIGDQTHNVAKMEQAGIGYRLQFKDVTTDTVLSAIHTVLGNASYRENMKRFSAVFREHQERSLDTAVWWIEYVIRHKGAPHLRSAALDLSWWQLLLLDVIAFFVATASIAIYLLYRIACYCKSLVAVNQKQKTA